MTNIPAGWYPDPSGSEQQRWWNGVAWSDQFAPNAAPVASGMPVAQPYSLGASYAVPTAPAGTQPYTTWIWLLAFLPVISVISAVIGLLTTDVDQMMGDSISNPFAVYTPITLLRTLISWAVMGLTILFAILDFRELRARGVERPFHWAFIFFNLLSAPVYVIGRSIVVRRRVGSGLTPLIVNVSLFAVLLIVTITAAIVTVSQAF